MRGGLEKYPEVSFINSTTFDDFLAEMIENYEKKYSELTGKDHSLPKAAPERMELYASAVMIYQGMQYIEKSGRNGLLKYSTGKFLDNLAAIKNVIRSPAISAVAIIKFSLSKAQSFDVQIPKGKRVKVADVYFATTESKTISAGQMNVEVPVMCLTAGTAGNGFEAGEIATIVDPINYVATAKNITVSSGGADEESDDSLAERVYLAPSGYSTAGPGEAYQYWIRSFNQNISDSFVTSENPGEVDIYVIFDGGIIPETEQLEKLKEYLENGSRKPLTDKVEVKAPIVNEYDIDVTYYISDSDRENVSNIHENIRNACDEYVKWQQSVIGRDINPSRLLYALIDSGACHAVINKPVFQEITTASISKAANVELIYGGLKDERTL